MSIAGHASREMLEHYSPVLLDAKRQALDALSRSGPSVAHQGGYGTKSVTNAVEPKTFGLVTETKDWSGREDLSLRPLVPY